LIASWNAYKVANEGATIAQWLMNAAMNANPIVLIVTLIGGLVAALVTLWHTNDDFKNALIGAWDAIKNAAVVVWESIVKFFTEDIPNAFNAVINFVKDNWQSLLLFITNPIAGALKLLYDLNPKFKEWVDNIWKTVTTFFTDIWNDITGFFSKAWEGIKAFLDNPAYYIGYVIGWIFGQIKEFFTKTIPEVWNAFTTWLSNSIASIGNSVKKFFTQTIPDVWEGFRNWLSEKFESLKGAIKTFFTETIPNAWDNLKTKAKELFESIEKTITNFFTVTIPQKWEDFKKNTKDKINSIKDWFKELPNQLKNIGKNIVEGLWDGIKNAWNWLKDKVSGLFGNLVKGIKDGLGIHSPSRLFRDEIGKMMALGLGEGWEDEFGDIQNDIDKSLAFDDPSMSINASIRKVGSGATSGAFGGTSIGNININVDGAKYQDEQSLAVAIAEEIQRMTDRRLAVYA
jgi:phage-related protein